MPRTVFVACLCAQWCGTCRDYHPLFEQLARTFPEATFRWVDIEDEADLVDPIEVEDFPTVLIGVDQTVHFFGTVLPHIETLKRLVSKAQTETASLNNPAATDLLQRLAH